MPHYPIAARVAAAVALFALPAMLLPAEGDAAERRKYTRSEEARMTCAYLKPVDPKGYKECLARHR